MPEACAACRPSHTAASNSAARRGGSFLSRLRRAASDSPATSSIAKNGRPSALPSSYRRTTLACDTAAIAAASDTNRVTSAGSALADGRIIFSATSRPSATCRARYTTPMPPRPNSSNSSYPLMAGRSSAAGRAACAPSFRFSSSEATSEVNVGDSTGTDRCGGSVSEGGSRSELFTAALVG